jgi:predicted ATP-dependent serine protease
MSGTGIIPARGNDPAQRYVCPTCRREHVGWSARCHGCHAYGLIRIEELLAAEAKTKIIPIETRIETKVIPLTAPSELEVADVLPDPSRPHLTIVRAPSPDPDLEVPAQESADVLADVFADPSPRAPSVAEPSTGSEPISLADVDEEDLPRDSTGLGPVDAVLGGGLVVGSAIVLWGDAGTGKSSLVMQMLAGLCRQTGARALIATGEESVQQAAARAHRLDAAVRSVSIVAETDLDAVLAHAIKTRCKILHVDSMQTLVCATLGSAAGSLSQIKECTRQIVKFGKEHGISVIVTAHATSDGTLAGPTTLKHLVDVVLELEVGAGCGGNERVLRASKNRFGSTAVVGRFELTGDGHVPMDGDGWDEKL